ncbi:MAG: B12-binding domain-containing radical SAM protein, partial [Clostridia bacterium]|nr:B12-binding domain-containing radical SAM protein [Clostridia bacterium]
MRILLINPATVGYSRSVTTPLGLLSIASSLQSKGHKVRLYDRPVEKVKAEKVFDEFRPELVGVSLVSFKSVYDALEMSEYAKKLSLPVVWGGPLASEIPETVLKKGCIDLVSIGEGEATWIELAEKFLNGERNFESVAGIAFRNEEGKTVITEARNFVDLGELPPIDWSLVDVPKYFQSSYECEKMLYLYCAKGCPHSCTFCYNKDFHRCTYRKRPLEHVLDEIGYLVKNHGMDGVYFADEMWGRNRSEMRMICDSLRSLDLEFVWGCQTRIGVFTEEDFKYMYDSGCRWVYFGVESGSENMLQKMNKRIPYDKIEETFS